MPDRNGEESEASLVTSPWPSLSRPRLLRIQIGLAALLVLMIPLGLGFLWLQNYLDSRPVVWIPYSKALLDRNLNEGRTVLVDFTAEWAIRERRELERPRVSRWMRMHDGVALRLDRTNYSQETRMALKSIEQTAAPVVVVYPRSAPDDPIVLSGMMITEEEVLAALKQAEHASR